MKVLAVVLGFLTLIPTVRGDEIVERARQLERSGDAGQALVVLEKAVRDTPKDTAVLTAYAEFLDRYNDPRARQAYERLLAALGPSADREKRSEVARRLVLLCLLDEDRQSAARYLAEYRTTGRTDWPPAITSDNRNQEAEPAHTIEIPGPLRSFTRMAAVSQDVNPGNLLPNLARNVVTNGYQASSSNEALDQTEYMKLLVRYVSQARELEKLAGPDKLIRIEACESDQTGDLLRVLGYRMRGGCGSEVVLETVNATRAFLTIDSGFPLAELEQDLRTNRPFVYDFKPTEATVLYGADYWLSDKQKQRGEFIDAFLGDPSLCRLYLGLAKLDRETAAELRKAVPMQKLKAFAHVLDFFGGMFEIREGKAVVPGGARSRKAWENLAGVSPDRGAAFFENLISKDDGWMASYFDALARIHGPAKDYLTEPERMKRFYMAIRGRVTSPGPARPVFRSNTEMVLLTTRLRIEPDGKPHIPGNLEVWKNLFADPPHGNYDKKLTRSAPNWKDPDDLIEALFALCRKAVDNEPLKIFMAMSDLNRERSQPLQAATVERLVAEYRQRGAQYIAFSEIPAVTDKTILQFLDTIDSVDRIRNKGLEADAAGTMQALVSLWQILCRQGSIPASEADQALSLILAKFERFSEPEDLFDAGRAGVEVLLKSAHSGDGALPQDRLVDLLAGTSTPGNREVHNQVVQDMLRVFEAQKLVSLNTLFELADHLEALGRGEKPNTALINRFSSRISEIRLPSLSLTTVERNAFAFGYWTQRHIAAEAKLNLRAMIERAANNPEKLQNVKGLLTPFLRDTLIGFSYAHYAPPGAQVLYVNSSFVRSHDFIGMQGAQQTWRRTDLFGTGWPSSAGGRVVGSLAGLPYILAEAEQNFLVPEREQALIWGDLVPQMILSAKIPRWWNVSPAQMHWAGLHLRYGRSLLAEAAVDPARRKLVLEILERQATPARVEEVARCLEKVDVQGAVDLVTPSELFVLAKETLARQPEATAPLAREIRELAAQSPDAINYRRISRAFGTPKPTLTNSYLPELLYLRTFPTLMGYSSRIMAESWESNTLYWASLADEMHLSPAQLNVLIPEWTQQTVEKIFATHLEDWPAVLRSLRMVGEDTRLKTRKQMLAERKNTLE